MPLHLAEDLNQCLTDIIQLQQEIGRLTDSIVAQQNIVGTLQKRLIEYLENQNREVAFATVGSERRPISPLQVLKAAETGINRNSQLSLYKKPRAVPDCANTIRLPNSPEVDEDSSTHSGKSIETDTEDSGTSPTKLKDLDIRSSSFNSVFSEMSSQLSGPDGNLMDPVMELQESEKFSIRVEIGLLGRLPAKMKPHSQEEPVAVFVAVDLEGKNKWRFIKDRNQLYSLDIQLRSLNFPGGLPLLPTRDYFQSFTPWKVDVRIDMLNAYFNRLNEIREHLESQGNITQQYKLYQLLVSFSRTDLVDVPPQPTVTQGFLMRRSRFGQWKTNYYVLNGVFLDMFTQPEGSHLNTIMLAGGECRHLQVHFDGTADDMRYAFTITEAQTQGIYYFSAENEADRTRWLNAISEKMSKHPGDPGTEANTNIPLPYIVLPPHHGSYCIVGNRREVPQALKYDLNFTKPQLQGQAQSSVSISAASISRQPSPARRIPPSPERQRLLERGRPQIVGGNGATFGVKPEEAALLLRSPDSPTKIPSVVARCLHLLDKKRGYCKEGIFRISGVQSLLDDLEYEFDTWSDFDLLAAGIDVHTTATLLKRYFRKLPEPLMGLEWSNTQAPKIAKLEPAQRVPHLRKRVASMPDTNRSVLYAFIHLVMKVLKHEADNKMSCHSLDIVLKPALSIPAAILISLADNFTTIFGELERPLPPNPYRSLSSRENSQEPQSPKVGFHFAPQPESSIEI